MRLTNIQVGGAFADSSATWRWVFYINLVIGAIFAPAFFLLLPSIDLQVGVPLKVKILKMTDWFGIAVFNVFIICFVMVGNTTFPCLCDRN